MTAVERPNPARFDRKGTKIEWIKCKDISVVWASAQRPYNEKHAKRIASEFDPDMFDAIKVTMPNGNGIYHAIDGQHRKSAAEMLWGPEEYVPCEVLDAQDPARAAELFVEINSNRSPLHPINLFLANLTAGKETQIAINKIIKALGYKIGSQGKDNQIGAVAALESIYRQHGPDILALTLKALQETWGIDPNAVTAPLLRGYAAFLVEFKDTADLKRLRSSISNKYSPGNLVAVAKNYKEMHRISMIKAVKALLIVNYNKSKRSGTLRSKEGTGESVEE